MPKSTNIRTLPVVDAKAALAHALKALGLTARKAEAAWRATFGVDEI